MRVSHALFTNKIITKILLICALLAAPILGGNDCFTVVVGKNASRAGHVIMAHNEDDSPPQIVHHRRVPRRLHQPGDMVRLVNGGQLEQTPETWAYIWSEMPGMLFSDSYLNEWGVCIASDACLSREDKPRLTDGGISRMLRRIVAERATSAREGVHLAGELVEKFGYDASGRTYTICDPEEGWLFCAVNGKHWLAKRVPDDEVAIIANTYTIHEVNLADTANYLASADIVDYAKARGWHKPRKNGVFDFAAAYADPNNAVDSANFCRQWGGLRFVAAESIPLQNRLPFSVQPYKKLDVLDIMKILRDHYEGTNLYAADSITEDPHETGMRSICASTTQTSFIAELRRDLPLDIGLVYWVCLGPPCTSFYIPFYSGASDFPAGYATDQYRPSKEYYDEMILSPFNADVHHAFWAFSRFHTQAIADYQFAMSQLSLKRTAFEDRIMTLRKPMERTAVELYPLDPKAAMDLLKNFSAGLYLSAMEIMNDISPKQE